MRISARPILLPLVRSLLLAGLVLAATTPAVAKTFGPFFFDEAQPDVIILDGEIAASTALDFRRVLAAAPQATMLLINSPGGSVAMALLIADDVDRRHLATVIPRGSQCYSACAYIFLAGPSRRAVGRLGVHQISSDSPDLVSAQLAISDIIDMLTRFGTPPEVLTIMFRTKPDDMYVFSDDEIVRLQINRGPDLAPRTANGAGSQPASPVARAADPQLSATKSVPEDDARRFLDDCLRAWSGPEDFAIAFAGRAYADEVRFYGKTVSRPDVLADKERFVKRWPNRRYSARPSSVEVRCAPESCTIAAIVDWYVESDARHASSAGVTSLDFVWDPKTARITAENGQVFRPR